MTQQQLNRAVAQATGESTYHVARMGFSEVVMPRSVPLRLTQLYRRARSAQKRCPRARRNSQALAAVS